MVILFFLLFFSVSLVFISYVVFPLQLEILSRKRKLKNEIQANSEFIPITVIISAYNEEVIIGQKIESILSSDYPKDKLEILIGSDASDDGTEDIVNALAEKNVSIRFFPFRERRGKPSVLNELVDKATHPVIVLTDANVIFERKMLGKLIGNFRNEKVGLVGANILNIGMRADGISIQEKSYIERENMIKFHEGLLWGCMMGPFGGCYALRKDLYEKVPPHFLVDDFYICMKVIEKKFHAINDLEAICYEDVSNDIRQEFRRKARISAGNFQNLKAFRHLLFWPFTPVSVCFSLHKVIRWITPFLILLTWVSLAVASIKYPQLLFLLAAETLLLISPLFDWVLRKAGIHIKLLRFISYFVYMNLALLIGFFRYIRGIDSGVWTPTKRN